MAKPTAMPLHENEYVKEALEILKDQDEHGRTALLAVLTHIEKLEQQYRNLTEKLVDVRDALEKAEAQNHPAKSTMRGVTISIQTEGLHIWEGLEKLKKYVINACRAAVDTIQDKSASAVNYATHFLHIRPMLESMRSSLDRQVKFDDRAISKIEQISTEYHEAGRHLKNIGRAIFGKEIIQNAVPAGKVAKSVSAPFRAARSCCASMRKHADAALGGLTRLEDRAMGRTSIKADIQTYNKRIAEEKRDAPPTPERSEPSDPKR